MSTPTDDFYESLHPSPFPEGAAPFGIRPASPKNQELEGRVGRRWKRGRGDICPIFPFQFFSERRREKRESFVGTKNPIIFFSSPRTHSMPCYGSDEEKGTGGGGRKKRSGEFLAHFPTILTRRGRKRMLARGEEDEVNDWGGGGKIVDGRRPPSTAV